MYKKTKISVLLCLAAALTFLPVQAADNEEAYESYAGQVKILDLESADTAVRTTQAESQELVRSADNVKAISFRFVNGYTEYWSGAETEILRWTDQVYVHAGDVIVELKSTADEVQLAQLGLQLDREEESYKKQRELYEQQIINKKQTVLTLSGTERKIGQLELKKMQLEYEKYQSDAQRSLTSLNEQIAQLEQSRESSCIRARSDGYLYIANTKLYDSNTTLTVQTNQALFSIVSSGGCVLELADDYVLGAKDQNYNASVVSNALLCSEYHISGAQTLVYAENILTYKILESVCGIEPASKWAPKLNFRIPVASQTVVLKTSLVYDDDGNMLYTLLGESKDGSYDYTKRYYVNLLCDGIEQKQYVLLGPIVDDTVVILSGVSDGDYVLM